MARFDFYVIERQLAIFALLIGTLVTVIWINLAARGFSEFFSDTQAIRLLLLYVLFELPPSLFQSLTLAAFASSAYVAHRLYADRELWAMQSAGASPVRLMKPFAAFGILMAALSSVLVHEILPDSLSQGAGIKVRLQADISQFRVKPGQFLFPVDGVAVFVRSLSDSGELQNVFVHHGQSLKNEVTHFAKSARMVQSGSDTLFELQAGVTKFWDPKTNAIRTVGFDTMRFNLSELAQEFSGAPQLERYTTTASLLGRFGMDSASADPAGHRMQAEIHRRIAYSLAAFLFPVIGAASVTAGETFRVRRAVPIVSSLAAIVTLHLLGEFLRDQVLALGSTVYLLYLPAALGGALSLALIGFSLKPAKSPAALPDSAK